MVVVGSDSRVTVNVVEVRGRIAVKMVEVVVVVVPEVQVVVMELQQQMY